MLLVNDDGSVNDMFCRTLRLEGFEVWGALSAGEGLALADKHRPHAVVMDLRVPLDCVLDVLRQLRQQTGLTHIPVALITGDYHVNDEQAEKVRSLGATLRFKPVWLAELAGVARELVHASVTL